MGKVYSYKIMSVTDNKQRAKNPNWMDLCEHSSRKLVLVKASNRVSGVGLTWL